MDIEILLALQQLREAMGSLGTIFFSVISEFGTTIMIILVAPLVYWCINKKAGTQIILTLSISLYIGQVLKNICCVYRPWIRDARIKPVETAIKGATGYSFPSNHTGNGVGIYGTLAVHTKKKPVKALLILMAVLIGFSRNFLGVHTPQDVLVGFIVGIIAIVLSGKLMNDLDNEKTNGLKITIGAVILAILTLVFLACKPYPMDYVNGTLLVDPEKMVTDCFRVLAMIMGGVIGLYLERNYVKFTTNVAIKEKLTRYFGGIITALIIYLGLKKCGDLIHPWVGGFLSSFTVMLFLVAIWPKIFRYFEERKR